MNLTRNRSLDYQGSTQACGSDALGDREAGPLQEAKLEELCLGVGGSITRLPPSTAPFAGCRCSSLGHSELSGVGLCPWGLAVPAVIFTVCVRVVGGG